MGLSEFEECSSSSSYCSLSINRSLTKRLIDLSNCPTKSSSRFAHTPEWADGLDSWSSSLNCPNKTDLSRRNFDFHKEIGLYLPRYEKPKSAPISLKPVQINSKLIHNPLPPERIRHLLKKEKDLLSDSHFFDDQSSIVDIPSQVPTNTYRSATSLDLISTNDIRLPFRHLTKKCSTPDQQLNQDALKSLLEEHLTSLLTRGASTINPNRTTSVPIPTLENKPIRIDSKFNDERQSLSTQQNKTTQFVLQQRSSPLGLAITPVDISPQRHLQSGSLEKLTQQQSFLQDTDTSSITSTSRPSTEPVAFPPPTHRYQQQQKVVLKRNLETIKSSSSGDLLITNDNSTKFSEQQTQAIQQIRKGYTHHGSSPNSRGHRTNTSTRTTTTTTTTTIELLPPIVSGKRLHISLANHRYL